MSEGIHVNLQWKNIDACYDFYCVCNPEFPQHRDGDFQQQFTCGAGACEDDTRRPASQTSTARSADGPGTCPTRSQRTRDRSTPTTATTTTARINPSPHWSSWLRAGRRSLTRGLIRAQPAPVTGIPSSWSQNESHAA
jgi:hypothetical protein